MSALRVEWTTSMDLVLTEFCEVQEISFRARDEFGRDHCLQRHQDQGED